MNFKKYEEKRGTFMRYIKNENGLTVYVSRRKDGTHGIFTALRSPTIPYIDKTRIVNMLARAFKNAHMIDFTPIGLKTAMAESGNIIATFPDKAVTAQKGGLDKVSDEMVEYFRKNRSKALFYDDSDMAHACKACLEAENKVQALVDEYVKKYEELKIGFNKGQAIYKVPARDVLRLVKYAQYLLSRGNEMYLKTQPGIYLDDMYERVSIKEEEYQKIELPGIESLK